MMASDPLLALLHIYAELVDQLDSVLHGTVTLFRNIFLLAIISWSSRMCAHSSVAIYRPYQANIYLACDSRLI